MTRRVEFGLHSKKLCVCGAAPKEKVVVDLHPVTAEWDGAHIVFVAKLSRRRWRSTHTLLLWGGAHIVFVVKLSRRRWQSTCPSSSLGNEMCFILSHCAVAKPPSGRFALARQDFKLRRVLTAAKSLRRRT